MIEFFKCLAAGFAMFAAIGVITFLYYMAMIWNAEVVAWIVGITLGLAIALWVGAILRSDL